MASNGAAMSLGDTENSLEKIKKQLTAGSGRNLLQGPLLKRSETLRKWNERWVILDPTTGKMEYKLRRNEPLVKGIIFFDSNSTITISPVNFQGLPKYDGCCFYIATPQKKEYFLCAETPGAARAWVSTLQAAQLVLKAHKEAVNSLSGNGSATLGTVATVVAAANSTALEASKEIEAAMKISMRAALGLVTNNKANETNKSNEGQMDNLTIMKETLKVKDEELQQLARELRARDATIKEIAEKLTDTAEAAEAAASAAYAIEEERRSACTEIDRLTKETEKQLQLLMSKVRTLEEQTVLLSNEKNQIIKQRDSALQEAHMWRSELAKAREHVVILEAAVLRAEERARVAVADAETLRKDAAGKESVASNEKEELLAYINVLHAQVQRQQNTGKHIFEEKAESCPDGNVDKACLSVSRSVPPSEDGEAVDKIEADVKEISLEAERSSLDIPVVSPPVDLHDHGDGSPEP